MRVVDASVVLSWLLKDPISKPARQALDDHVNGSNPAVAPELLQYEVTNVLARGAGLPADAATAGYAHFLALEVHTLALGRPEYQRALQLALRFEITSYDASYLALAHSLGTRFVTGDRKLAKRVARLGIVDIV